MAKEIKTIKNPAELERYRSPGAVPHCLLDDPKGRGAPQEGDLVEITINGDLHSGVEIDANNVCLLGICERRCATCGYTPCG